MSIVVAQLSNCSATAELLFKLAAVRHLGFISHVFDFTLYFYHLLVII